MATKQKAKSGVPEGFNSANVRAEFWKPETAGDSISGWYQGCELRKARDNYPEQMVYEIADENGELHLLSGAALKSQFERVNEGDPVVCVFHGRVKSKPGRADMKDIEVFVKGDLKPFKRND
jgi:hypothetical protein